LETNEIVKVEARDNLRILFDVVDVMMLCIVMLLILLSLLMFLILFLVLILSMLLFICCDDCYFDVVDVMDVVDGIVINACCCC